jgi:polyisoprenoid-binding protein YceI
MSTAVKPETRSWVLDPARSVVEFAARSMWGLQAVRGRFERFEGEYVDGPAGRSITLTIDAASVNTGNRMRDDHLRGPDFFDVGEHPQVRFVSTRIDEAPDGSVTVHGDLEAGGVTRRVDVATTITELGDELEVSGTVTVDHRAFGMSDGVLGMIRPSAALHVVARLRPVSGDEE